MDRLPPAAASVLRALIEDYRDRCLWFLRSDYCPASPADALRLLDAIERRGERTAFPRCYEIRQWLSPSSSAASAGS